ALPDARRGRRRRRDGRARPERDARAGDARLGLGGCRPPVTPPTPTSPTRSTPRSATSSPGAERRAERAGVQSPLVWLLLALPAALFQVLRNASMKRLGHALDEYINVWGRFTFLLPWALLACLVGGVPTIKPEFYAWCAAFGVTQTLATLALSKALKLSDISLVTPLWKVSLLILLGMAWVTIDERPSALGITGVLLSALGVYLLNIRRARVSPW